MNWEIILNNLNFSNLAWQIVTPLIFSFFDIITGLIQAKINNDIDSQKMRIGLSHKILIIIIIILSFVLQFAFSINYISGIVCGYIVLMELVSILENLKKAGINLGKITELLKEKTDDTTAESVSKLINKIDKIEGGK